MYIALFFMDKRRPKDFAPLNGQNVNRFIKNVKKEIDMEQKQDIDIMLKIQTCLTEIPLNLRNDDYDEIAKLVDNYVCKRQSSGGIETQCEHNIIRDDIDLTPDSSMVIYYCTKCYYQPK